MHHALHIRLPRHFVLEERLQRYAGAIEPSPHTWRGWWTEAFSPISVDRSIYFEHLCVDLGCGKGAFLVEAARREPHTLFIGIDNEPICIAYAAQAIQEAKIPNAVVVPGSAQHICLYFKHEINTLYLNFPTPLPKSRDAEHRLTYFNHLLDYYRSLSTDGKIIFKTDSLPLWRWSLDQFHQPECPFFISWTSQDTRHDYPLDPETGYERKLIAKGASVFSICARPDHNKRYDLKPYSDPRNESNCHRGLIKYLPDDLDSMSYVPHGMEATVVNLVNFRAKQQLK